GRTVLLSTQYLEEADRLADTIAVIDHGRVIAEGTASELKAKVGGDLLELTVRYKTHVARAAKALAGIGSAEPKIDDGAPRITVPVAEGANVLAKAVRNLDRAKVSIADLAVRRPTLDDVFLALTG